MKRASITFKSAIKAKRLLSFAATALAATACSGGAGVFSALAPDGTGKVTCAITNSIPSTAALKVSGIAGTITNFNVGLADPSCTASFTVNGTVATSASGSLAVDSANLVGGTNTIIATVGGTTNTWIVTKNNPPSCTNTVPAFAGNAVQLGAPAIDLTTQVVDADSDPFTISWNLGGTAVPNSVLAISTQVALGITTYKGSFTPTSGMLGANTVNMVINDGTDSTSCAWSVAVSSNPVCAIVSAAPSTTTYKMPYASSSVQSFAATANDPSCLVTWKLNGTTIAGATNALVNVISSQLADGPATNTLQAVYANGTSTATRTWTVNKNRPATCSSQTPAATGNNVGMGSSLNLQGTAANLDNNTLAYTWTLNGSSISNLILNTVSSGNVSNAVFTPTSAQIGANVIGVGINDGYDTAACSWNVGVNPACTLSGLTPSNASALRVANTGSTSTAFQTTASAGCSTFSWTLNGTAIGGATSANYNVLSSALSTGNNTLQVSLTNGTSTDTKSWTVVKNTPPTCSSQSPAASGSSVGIGNNITLTANANDANADALTFAWQNNGSAVSNSFFTVTNGSTNSQAVFAPDASYVGNNSISAIISDGYDATSCSWSVAVIPQCTIASASPSTSTYKIPYSPTSIQAFVATANDPSCTVVWKLNGTPITGQTASVLNLTSSQLNDGPASNTLQAVYTNSSSTVTRSWTVTKNRPALCSSQTPAQTGNSLGTGSNMAFSMTASNLDSDTVTYNWLVNNAAVSTGILNPSSAGNTSGATFYPTAGFVGPNIVTSVINDGYDTNSCNWNVTVNGNCAISSTTPTAGGTVRVANTGSTSTPFNAITSSGCSNYTWTLNGTPISGATGATYNALSSNLLAGANTLRVDITNGTSADNKSWTVVKNTPPVCSSQTPAATGNTVGVGSNITLTANGTDANSDTLSFAWADNGSVANPSFFTVTPGSGTSQAVFAPDSSFVGNNNVSATISDGYDTTTCNYAVAVTQPCTIASSVPSTTTFKVPFAAATNNTFTAVGSSSCTSTVWTLNGSVLSGQTSSTINLTSSQLQAGNLGANTIVATISNASSTATKTWNVTKNQLSTCASITPAATGNSLGTGANLAFSVTPGNPDSDTLAYTWNVNNVVVATSDLNPSVAGGTSNATFYPTSSYVGPNLVSNVVWDGYDTTTCNWNVTVNGSCAIGTTTPSAGGTIRVSNVGTTSTSFNAPTSPSCSNYTWTLNGTTISGATGATYNALSSGLLIGANTLSVAVTNGTSSDTKSWTVVKNSPPVCASQTPAATGNAVGVGANITLTANGTDANGDTMTFAWTDNGAPANVSYFTITNGAGTSQAVFAPNASFIGNNNVIATISDGYDTTTCSYAVAVAPSCSLTSTTPSTTTAKIPYLATTSNSFVATANDVSCTPIWKLNGTTLGGQTSSVLNLTSSALLDGPATNSLQVIYSNGSSTASKTWTVTKNQLSTCASITPAASGNSLGTGANMAFGVTAGNADSDTLTYAWQVNNANVSTAVLNPTSAGNATFYPTAGFVGPNIITSIIADGYDNVSCNWNVTVNGNCAITTTTPTVGSSVRVANQASTSTSFNATTSPSCSNYTWTLNGTVIGTATSATYNALSSALATGNNTLLVSVTNGTSSDSKSWTIVKNTPPVCSSQTPAATGNTIVVGSPLTYTANGTDANSDTLTFAWANNGTTANPSFFTVTNGTGTSNAVFTPDASFIGSNALVATISDGYDTTTCNWTSNVLPQCSIISSSPSTATYKIANAAGTSNSFVATANDSSCTVTWKLNGSVISGQTNPTTALLSSAFSNGSADTLQAVYSNGSSTATRTWTVTKNTLSTCASQTPIATGNSVGVGANIVLQGTAGNTDSDTLTYGWLLGNTSVSTSILNPTSSGNSSQATFYPLAGNVGANTVTMNINDGYDVVACNWAVTVNPTCQITATTPSAGTNFRVAAASGTTTGFTTTASTGCNTFTWTLNGTAIGGATGQNYSLPSSILSTGSNTLVETVTNGSSSDTKSWIVVKNTPPLCSSQTPAATGTNLGSGQSLTLTATGTDADSDPLSFSWKDNNVAVSNTFFTITNGTGNSQAAFVPNATFVGTNTIQAIMNDGYDNTSCTWTVTVQPQCTISSSTPSTATYTVPNLGTASQTYIANVNDPSCTVVWKVNGTVQGGQTSPNIALTSSALGTAGPGTNTVQAIYSNATTTTTRTWTVTKNQPATCNSQLPTTGSATNVGVGGNVTFSMGASNPAADTLTYNWLWNGSAVDTSKFAITSAGNSTQAVFTPTAGYVGNNSTATVSINDGYDTSSCAWTVNVSNACAITAAAPSTATYKIANSGTTSNAFAIVSSDSTCVPTWKLTNASNPGGLVLDTGANKYLESFNSSQFDNAPGTNTLSVVIDNGVTTTTRSWTVTKNRVPTCVTTPSANPTPFPYTATSNFSTVVSDADGDSMSGFSWTFNGSTSNSRFPSVTSTATTSATTLVSGIAQIGTGQVVAFNFSDGYDTNSCSWTMNILNPNSVTISACNPLTSPVVIYTAGPNSSQNLQVVASNAATYQWIKGGTNIGGATNDNFTIATGAYPTGTYTVVGQASDALGNNASCTYTVKMNAKPVITAITPAPSTTTGTISSTVTPTCITGVVSTTGISAGNIVTDITHPTAIAGGTTVIATPGICAAGQVQISANAVTSYTGDTLTFTQNLLMNYGSTLAMSVTATDANSDTLSYSWTLDGATNAALPTGSSTTTFNPNFNTNLLGSHTIMAAVSDGYETTTQSWTVVVNMFTQTCDDLYNGTTNITTGAGGKVCTLVGIPTAGMGITPSSNQSLVRMNPVNVIDDGSGNWIISDQLNNTIVFYNRSGSPITRFGITVAAGTLGTIVGNGALGTSSNNVYNTNFKMNAQGGIAYDSVNGKLFIADYGNSRVEMIDNTGYATQILGNVAAGNSTAWNTDGALGSNHWCANPNDLRVVSWAGAINLYVSCYGSNAIKRVDIKPASGNYLNAYMVVGSTTVPFAGTAGVVPAGEVDGTLGVGGYATATQPMGLGDDGLGNIYWTEWTSGNRIRMATTGGSAMTFFGGLPNYNTTAATTTISALDTAAVSLTTGSLVIKPTLNAGPASKLSVTGPTSIVTSNCSAYNVQIQNAGGTAAFNSAGATTVTFTAGNTTTGTATNTTACITAVGSTAGISAGALVVNNTHGASIPGGTTVLGIGTGGCAAGTIQISANATATWAGDSFTFSNGTFYSDSACTVANPVATIATATSSQLIYYKNTSAGSAPLINTTNSGALTNIVALGPVAIAAAGVATKFVLLGPTVLDYTTCQRYTIQQQNAGNVSSTSAGAKTIHFAQTAQGSFYTGSTCALGTLVNSLTMGAGVSETPVYFNTVVAVPANSTVSLMGNVGVSTNIPNSVAPVTVGSVTNWAPRGIAVATSGGVVTGFFFPQWTNARIVYANNTASSVTYGGTTIPAYQAGPVAGSGAAGFNTDGLGNTTKMNTAWGVNISTDGNTLLIPDYNNYRMRTLDLSTANGQFNTILGAGYARAGNLGDSPAPAANAFLNTPGQEVIDTTNNILYVSDSGNGRIRKIDLITGYFSTIAGQGVGAAVTENVPPTTTLMNSPRGLALMNSNSTNFLVYADQQTSTGVNQDCMIRAINLTSPYANPAPTPASIFTVSINPTAVATVAGDYGLGCVSWNTGPANTNGGAALNNHLYNPEGIATDGTNLIIALYNDHCIVKMKPDGTMSTILGVCGTVGTTADGLSNVPELLRYPMGVAMDTYNVASPVAVPSTCGNFFFTDDTDQVASRLRYANFCTNTVKIGNMTIPAGSATIPYIFTLQTITPTPASPAYLNTVATFGIQICVAGGEPTPVNASGGNMGTHNVTCFDRSNLSFPTSLRVGPNELSSPPIRAGAPLDLTQEGVVGASVLMNAPYGLAFDATGNMYISERSNHIIRMVRRWW